MGKQKKICGNCSNWEEKDSVALIGFCESDDRKKQKGIPLGLCFITSTELPGCDFWKNIEKGK